MTDGSKQTVQTLIRLLPKEQFDQGLHCLPFHLQLLDTLLYCKTKLFHSITITVILRCPNYKNFTVVMSGPPMLADKTNFGLVFYNYANFCRFEKTSRYRFFSAFHWSTSDTPPASQSYSDQYR